MDDDMAVRALEWMAKPHARGVGGPDVDYQGSVAFFSNQSAAFALNGEWEVTTYQAHEAAVRHDDGADDVRPARQPGRLAHVRHPARSAAARASAWTPRCEFIARLVNKRLDWAKGGHVPAYRPIFDSDEYRKLSPQSDYASAAEQPRVRPAGLVQRQRLELRDQRRLGLQARRHRRQSARGGAADVPRLPGATSRETRSPSRSDEPPSPPAGPCPPAPRAPGRPATARGGTGRAGAGVHRAVLRPVRRSSCSGPCSSRCALAVSTTRSVGDSAWAGLENYCELFGDSNFWEAMWHTAVLHAAQRAAARLIAAGLALLVSRVSRVQWLFRLSFFAPYVLPVSVVVLVWNWLYQPGFGLINSYLTRSGWPR